MLLPPGFAPVFPYMTVRDAPALIAFLTKAFRATEIGRSVHASGRIMNAELRISGAHFMVGEPENKDQCRPGSYYIFVENADRAMAQALESGAKMISPVSDKPYGDRQGGVEDPVGNWWWISQRMVAGPYQHE
ncbi:MAG: VOC family protein [Proteobacteria bacterium]|nr:MAG: VOC family protein [Pseudomonadota bacterium]